MGVRSSIQRMLQKRGVIVYRAETAPGYTKYLPYNDSTYAPWFEDWFQQIYQKVKKQTLVTDDRCYVLYKFGLHCRNLEGDFAECGVYKGGTASLIARTLKTASVQHKKLHLFDTFAGIPNITEQDPSRHRRGDFKDVSIEDVGEYLKAYPYVVFNSGFIPETFEAVKDKKFAFVHIDTVLYQTAKDCCSFFYDRMIVGGVMIFDDYGFPRYKFAEKRAVDEFFDVKPESLISLPTGQCIVIKGN